MTHEELSNYAGTDEDHKPSLITLGDRHTVPGEVCMGCSDPDNGVWVPVLECEEARALMNEDDPGSLDADIYTVQRDTELPDDTAAEDLYEKYAQYVKDEDDA